MKWEEDEDKDYVIMTKEDGTSSSSGSQEAEEDEECPKVLLDTESNVSRLWFSFTTFLYYYYYFPFDYCEVFSKFVLIYELVKPKIL